MKCNSLECHSQAVAILKMSGKGLCNRCALKVHEQGGELITIEGEKFPWEYEKDITCQLCGNTYNRYLLAHTGGCPKCHQEG